jgi:hypothetical protein
MVDWDRVEQLRSKGWDRDRITAVLGWSNEVASGVKADDSQIP